MKRQTTPVQHHNDDSLSLWGVESTKYQNRYVLANAKLDVTGYSSILISFRYFTY